MLKRLFVLLAFVTIIGLLSGCFRGEQSMQEMDPPQNAEEVNSSDGATEDAGTDEATDESEGSGETTARQLYLLDASGMIAAQTIELPMLQSKEVAKQVLEHLVVGGPVSSMLPNGFQAVLPEGTEILGINVQEDGTAIVDVSEEFGNYQEQDEVKILEAITYTLTQFENVDNVQLRMNGHPITEMPVNGTPINDGYSRANGINITQNDVTDYLASKAVTMYFPKEHNESRYYVPVTQYVSGDESLFYQSIVQTLLDGPGYATQATHVFNTNTELVEEPKLENGVLKLVFSNDILKEADQGVISDEVIETLVRTLTEQNAVEAVEVSVENVDQLVNENGDAYTEPVSKQHIVPAEKL